MAGLGAGGLSAEQFDQFDRDGFLAVEGLLTDDDLAPLYDEYERILAGQVDQVGTHHRRVG